MPQTASADRFLPPRIMLGLDCCFFLMMGEPKMKFVLSLFLATLAVCVVLLLALARPSVLNAMPAQDMAPGANLNCSSEDGGRKFCPTNTKGGVQLVKQRSGSPCIFDQTWGYDNRGVWVDRGCRADFAVGFTGGSGGP